MATHAKQIEIIARGLIQSGSRVLLCRCTKHGYLYLPGGHVEHSEPARDALEREMVEEAGVDVAAGELILTHEHTFIDRKGLSHHEINLVFHVEHHLSSATLVPSKEPDIEFDWVEIANVVDLDVRPAGAKAFIAAGRQNDRFLSECADKNTL